jgi:hypothetical protein
MMLNVWINTSEMLDVEGIHGTTLGSSFIIQGEVENVSYMATWQARQTLTYLIDITKVESSAMAVANINL